VRRSICFESNEGTVETECKVDLQEIVDSNDESIIISSDGRETTSSDEIEDDRENFEEVCINVLRLKPNPPLLMEYQGKITPRSGYSFSLASRKFRLLNNFIAFPRI